MNYTNSYFPKLILLILLILAACDPKSGVLTPSPSNLPQSPTVSLTAPPSASPTLNTPTQEVLPLILTQAAIERPYEIRLKINPVVVRDCLNVRVFPSNTAERIDCLPEGDVVELTGAIHRDEVFLWVQIYKHLQSGRTYCDEFTPIECPWQAAAALGTEINYLTGVND